MIHVHRWKSLIAGNRDSWVEPYTPGCTVSDIVGTPDAGTVLRNGRPCKQGERLDDFDHLDLVIYPTNPVVWQILISIAVSFAIRALMPEPEKAKERGDERSPTHGFGSLQNIRAEGQPIPVLYGEHIEAGTIFNEFVEVNNATGQSTYFALIGLGHGPVEEIAGETVDTVDTVPLTSEEKTAPSKIFLQGNPLRNFHKTKAWIRLGSNEQKLVPGFEKSRRATPVNVELVSAEVGVGAPNDLIPGLDFGVGGNAAYEKHWDDFGFAFDANLEDVDGTEVVMFFSGGLYSVTTEGFFTVSRWVLGIRFCKLDANGNPILGPGFGGNADDGWVRLPHEEFSLDRQNAFQLGFPVSFYDPTDFIPPIPGDAYRVTDWSGVAPGDYIQTVLIVDSSRMPSDWTDVIPNYTFECWVAWDLTGASGPFSPGLDEFLCMNEWSSAGDNGVWIGFKIDSDGSWKPHFRVGKWSRQHTWPDVKDFIVGTTDANDKKWNHLVWSHKRINSSTNVTRFWINGTYMGEFLDNVDIIAPNPINSGANFARMRFGWSSVIYQADYSAKVWWDEVIIHSEFFETSDVLLRWNGGGGIRHSDADPALVLLLHIEGGLTDSTGFGNHCNAIGSGALDIGAGKITKTTAPGRTRGRYRVQCVRINGESIPGGTGTRRQDTAEWQLSVTWIDQTFIYPGIAYTAIEVEATEQLNTSAPTVTQVVKGRLVRVWDRISTVAPTFNRVWSQNTAWIALDVATDELYGGGQAFQLENTDLVSFALFADRCDERVYDGRGKRHFYRQDYEVEANKCNSPTSIDAFWASLLGGGPAVTLNTAEAPNGELEADTLDDTDGTNMEGIGFTFLPSTEPSFYSVSAYVKKDLTITGHTSGIRITVPGSSDIEVAFNLNTGDAVANCIVEDFDDNWWYVKATPFFYNNNVNITCYYLPAAFTRGTTTVDGTLTGDMTVWGFSIHRGSTHVAHPDIAGPRAYLFMASEDSSEVPQTIPGHWIAGYELRIRAAVDPTWDTTVGLLKTLEIVEVQVFDVMDGYDRVWSIVCKWPTEQDRPLGVFPDLIQDGRDWADIPGEWTLFTGVTATGEFDDGGTLGGPDDPDPKFSQVCEVAGATAFTDPIEQLIPSSVNGNDIIARAHIYKPDTGTNPQLKIDDQSGGTDLADPPDLGWNKVSVTQTVTSGVALVGIGMAGAASTFWLDGLGCWEVLDAGGRAPGGTVEGSEALFKYDSIHDTFKGLWDTLVAVLLTARASPVREGNQLRIKFEAKRDPVGLLTIANVVRDGDESSFKVLYTNDKVRPNSVIIDFQDREKNWERSSASVDHSSVEETTDAGLIRRESYFLQGVTRRSHVIRHGLYHLEVNATIIRQGTFISDPSAITYEPGDKVAVGHDLVPWGQGGRATRESGTATNLISNSEDFSLWTISTGEVLIVINSMSTPGGFPTADQLETLVSTQVTVAETITGISSGSNYTFSVRVKRLVGNKFAILMVQSGGQSIIVEYEWAIDSFTQFTGVTGVTLTREIEADGWIRLGFDILTANTNDVTVSLVPERGGALGTKIWVADAQFEKDETIPTDYSRPGAGIYIDREVVLGSGSYLVRVVSSNSGKTAEGTVTSGIGTFAAGSVITFTAGSLPFVPQEGDVYLIFTESERMEVQIAALRIREDLRVDVDWVESDDSIFDGDDVSDDLFSESEAPGSDDSNTDDPRHSSLIPESPVGVSVIEMTDSDPSGMPRQVMDVSWGAAEGSQRDLMEHNVFLAYLDSDSLVWTQPRLAGTAPGSASSLRVPLAVSVKDKLCWVMVQPVSYGGARTAPRELGGTVISLGARHPKPDPPTNFLAHMEGDKITYSWDPPVRAEGLIYEIRLSAASPNGGWVLGVKMGETKDTVLGPTVRWSSAGDTSPVYYLRARNRQGVYSDAVSLQYTARVLNDVKLTSSNHWWSLITQAWHDYADGWETDSVPPLHDPTLNNLQRHADGHLEFSGSNLTGTYTTAKLVSGESPNMFEIEERLRLEVLLVATCLNPKRVGESNVNADLTTKRSVEPLAVRVSNPWAGNETVEGNLQETLPTITVQMKLVRESSGVGVVPVISTAKNSSGSTGWLDWRPGEQVCHGAQFRLVVTRPDSSWDVRIHEFYTAAYRVLPERHYRTPLESRLARRHGLG